MHNGYAQIYRRLINKGFYKKSQHVHLWIHLILKANHKEKEFMFNKKNIVVKRGQLITGRKILADETGINESKVERILKFFEIEQQIEQQKTNLNRLITITNYNTYHKSEQQSEQQVNNKRTTSEQQVNTTNNDNNDNNDNKKEYLSLFEKIWKKYPKPLGKKQAYKHFLGSVKSEQASLDVSQALDNYLAFIVKNKTEYRFIQNGSTWFNDWQAWVNPTPLMMGENIIPVSTRPKRAKPDDFWYK
jgi:hypothetical protein